MCCVVTVSYFSSLSPGFLLYELSCDNLFLQNTVTSPRAMPMTCWPLWATCWILCGSHNAFLCPAGTVCLPGYSSCTAEIPCLGLFHQRQVRWPHRSLKRQILEKECWGTCLWILSDSLPLTYSELSCAGAFAHVLC